MRHALLATILLGVAAPPALANEYGDFPAPVPYPFQRSTLTGQAIAISPYDQPFGVRVYTTPQHQPFYNVPPYAVIVPY